MFGDTLIALNKGATVAELDARLSEVVAAVRATAKPGAITLTLKIVPGSKDNAELVFINPEVKIKTPATPQGSTLFFTTEDNRLTRNDERQHDLPFESSDVKVIEMNPNTQIKEAM
jgi:hypothetical protein